MKNKKLKKMRPKEGQQEQEQLLEDISIKNNEDERHSLVGEKQKRNKNKRREEVRNSKGIQNKEVKNQVTVLDFFTESVLNKITKGSLDIQGAQFELSYSKVLSEKHKKRVIFIREFPERVFAGHLELIRTDALKKIPPSIRKDMGINIVEHSIPNHIRFTNNKKMVNTEKAFRRQKSQVIIDRNIKVANIKTARSWSTSKDDVQLLDERIARLNRKIDSFDEIKGHQAKGGETLKTFIFIEVTGTTLQQVDDLTDIVLNLLADNRYKHAEITDLENYLKTFGLASINYNLKPAIDLHPMTITTDVSSASQSYTEGIIRSEQGDVYLGHSIESQYPIHVSFSESSDGATILVVASSGSGKTVWSKTVAFFALNHRGNTYNNVINDFKGEEWTEMAKKVKGSQVISFGIDNPKFINTLIIPDYKKYGFKSPTTSYTLSASFTTKKLSILVGTSDKTKLEKIENVCSDIVERVYNKNEIDIRQPSTYIRSKDLNFRESIWDSIQYITSQSDDMEKRHGKEILAQVKTSLEYYFSPTGSKGYMFSNPIDIDTMMESKFLVFDYGMQTAGGSATLLDKELDAKIFQKEYFTNLYSAYNKLKGEYTVEYDEEVSRQLSNPTLMKSINDKVTGGRSSNRINVLIINSADGLLGSDNPDAVAIRENINTIVLGRVRKEEAIKVVKYFGLESAMTRVGDVISGNGKYENTFLCAVSTGKMYDMSVVRVILPNYLYDSPIFKSKDVEKNKVTAIM